MKRLLCSSVVALVSFAGAASVPARPATVVMEDLGALPGGDSSAAFSINNAEQVVGQSDTVVIDALGRQELVSHAFVWDRPNGMRDLGTGLVSSRANAISNRDVDGRVHIVGENGDRAVLWENRVIQDLGFAGAALDVNDSGQVVGYAGTFGRTAVLWDNGTIRDLGAGFAFSIASGINNPDTSGRFQVVGVADLPDSSRHAILWESDGTVRDLGVLRSAQHFDLTDSGAVMINDAGQVAGTSITGQQTFSAFLLGNGIMRLLGTIRGLQPGFNNCGFLNGSFATGLNGSGDVVGYSNVNFQLAPGKFCNTAHGFLWRRGVMVDLGVLPSAGTDYADSLAYAVNNLGQVVGEALAGIVEIPNGFFAVRHAFLAAVK